MLLNIFQKFREFFKCPPHLYLSKLLTIFICLGFMYIILYCFDPKSAIPGNCSSPVKKNNSSTNFDRGNLFGLFILFVCAIIGGKITQSMKLPPLLGMLIAGFILRNVHYVDVAKCIDNIWSDYLRKMALLVILIRAGLGLDPKILKKLSFIVVRLAFIPCLVEAVTAGVTAHFVLKFPWGWSFILGFVLSAVSPAVVVPSILELERKGYGIDKGINTLIIAAASIDDVLAITGFGITLAITFSTTNNVTLNVFRGPMEAIAGVSYGIIFGFILWFLPSYDNEKFQFYRTLSLFLSAIVAMFGSVTFNMPGAGPLAVLTLSFVASMRWKRDPIWKSPDNPIVNTVEILWWILQPFLFGLIGAGLDIRSIGPQSLECTKKGSICNLKDNHLSKTGFGILTFFIGLFFRLSASFLVLFRTEFNMKERLFVAIAWLPKATIQAAIGPMALDLAIKTKSLNTVIEHGRLVLAIAVISIILTAPLGATLISLTAPALLKKSSTDDNPERDIELKTPAPETQRLFNEELTTLS